MINRILKRKPKVKTPPTSGGTRVTTSGGQSVGNTKVTTGTGGSGNTRVTGNTNTGASSSSSASSKTVKRIKDILKKPVVRNTGIGAAVLGGTMLVGDQLTKDSPIPQGDEGPEPEKGPVFDTPDGPKQFPPFRPLPPLPKDETKKGDGESTKSKQYLRRGHWRAINDPPQFHRNPALASYRNIRATKKNY